MRKRTQSLRDCHKMEVSENNSENFRIFEYTIPTESTWQRSILNASAFSLRIFANGACISFSPKYLLNTSIMFLLYPLISLSAEEVNSGSVRVDVNTSSDVDPSHKTLVVC